MPTITQRHFAVTLLIFFCTKIPACEPNEGFGAATQGGGKDATIIEIDTPTEEALRDAFENVEEHSRILLPANATIFLTQGLALRTNYVTIDGRGCTLRGDTITLRDPKPSCVVTPTNDCSNISSAGAVLKIDAHDVIVKNLKVRNGYDNIRLQGTDVHDILISHVSSTGAVDDGISISMLVCPEEAEGCVDETDGPHDVTVQYSFIAGNTRSIFIKGKDDIVTNISLHHNRIMKQWVRGPIISNAFVDIVNNIQEDWAEWGMKFERGGRGNVAYNLYRQSEHAWLLGAIVDPSCMSIAPECLEDLDCCKYDGNGHKALDIVEGFPDPESNGDPLEIYTEGNWFQGATDDIGVRSGLPTTRDEEWDTPSVHTLRYWNDLEDEILRRSGSCSGPPGRCSGEIDQAYADAQVWYVAENMPFWLCEDRALPVDPAVRTVRSVVYERMSQFDPEVPNPCGEMSQPLGGGESPSSGSGVSLDESENLEGASPNCTVSFSTSRDVPSALLLVCGLLVFARFRRR